MLYPGSPRGYNFYGGAPRWGAYPWGVGGFPYPGYKLVMEFADNSGTASSIQLNDGGTFAVANWGDGYGLQEISTGSETTSQGVPTTIRLYAYQGVLTTFKSTDNAFDFDIADAPSGLTYLFVYGNNTISGDIANAPSGLTTLYLFGSNTLSGDIADAPSGLMSMWVRGSSNTLSGDIANAPSGLTSLYLTGSSTLSDYTSGRNWAGNMNYVVSLPTAGNGLSSTEVDNLLIDLADTTWTGGKVIDLSGENDPRTANSDIAVQDLQAMDVTVTTN